MKLLVVSVTLLLLRAAAQDDGCTNIENCEDCRKKCKWCAQRVRVAGPNDKQIINRYTVGTCISHRDTCVTVIKFGTSANFFDITAPNDALKVSAEVENVGKTFQCTNQHMPKSLAVQTCDACMAVAPAGSHGFCQMTFKVGGAELTGTQGKGGLCLPKSLGFLCQDGLFPYMLPEPYNLFNVNFAFVTTAAQCKNFTLMRSASVAKCEDNLNCKNCGNSTGGCTWCAAGLDAMGVKTNVFGKCVTGKNVDCATAVSFGTFVPTMNEFLNTYKGSFKPVAVPVNDAGCSRMDWPKAFATPTCTSCAENNQSWCQMDASIPLEKGTVSKLSGGFCHDKANEQMCGLHYGDFNFETPSFNLTAGSSVQSCGVFPTTAEIVANFTASSTPAATSTETQSTTSGSVPAALSLSFIVAALAATSLVF